MCSRIYITGNTDLFIIMKTIVCTAGQWRFVHATKRSVSGKGEEREGACRDSPGCMYSEAVLVSLNSSVPKLPLCTIHCTVCLPIPRLLLSVMMRLLIVVVVSLMLFSKQIFMPPWGGQVSYTVPSTVHHIISESLCNEEQGKVTCSSIITAMSCTPQLWRKRETRMRRAKP